MADTPSLVDLNPPAIIGEREAGRSAQVRKRLLLLVGDIAENTFDLADLLAEAIDENLIQKWGYDNVADYGETELGLKERKIQYLVRIVKVCKAVGLVRKNYEAAGVSKLREITRLDPLGSFFNPDTKTPEPLSEHIIDLISKAEEMTGTQILEEVRRLMGQTGGNRPVTKMMSWTEDTYNNVIVPAQELARRRLGSASRDAQGNAIEYTDSVVEEMIHAEFLADPNNQPEPEQIITEDEAALSTYSIPTEAE